MLRYPQWSTRQSRSRRNDHGPSSGRKRGLGDGRSAGKDHTNESFAAYCRRITHNGQTVAEMMLSIVKGIPRQMVMVLPSKDPDDPRPREVLYTATPPLERQMDAGKWLVDRGFGKAVEIVDVTDKPAFNLIFLGKNRDPLTTGELDRPKPAPKALDA